jgi:aspartyl-tRNA(Asn)/glutamyl-tRNA(Gln) amidotransferase subunit B
VGQAIEYEIARQGALYERGEPILQETLHFDSAKGETRSLRSKEEAHDYRYFPQPDLPPVTVSPDLLERLEKTLPETREKALERLSGLGLKEAQAGLLLERPGALEYFDKVLAEGAAPSRAASIMEELFLPACQREQASPMEAAFGPGRLAALARLIDDGRLGRKAARDLFPGMFQSGGDPEALIKEQGLEQIQDTDSLAKVAREVVEKHPKEVQKLKEGQDRILSFLVGQVMKLSAGRADPKKAGELIKEIILKEGGQA